MDDSSDEGNEFRRDYKGNGLKSTPEVLNKKISFLQERFRKVSVIEEDDQFQLEMMIMSEYHRLTSPTRSEGFKTPKTFF